MKEESLTKKKKKLVSQHIYELGYQLTKIKVTRDSTNPIMIQIFKCVKDRASRLSVSTLDRIMVKMFMS